MRVATRSSCKTLPVPIQRKPISLSLLYSKADAERMLLGHIPRDMDDKWFIFFEDGWLYFHRSWTGDCIYGVRLDATSDGVRIVDAWVSGDKGRYRSPGPEHDARLIRQLIASHLLS